VTGKCPASPALAGGVKGHNIKGKYLTGKPRPLGRGASLGGSLWVLQNMSKTKKTKFRM
jgi:hypothetical protein